MNVLIDKQILILSANLVYHCWDKYGLQDKITYSSCKIVANRNKI